ncbi:MAG TPA: PBP1A family penicillin-binding protein [Kofleriaceae bacterium]|nr:PBP1A family penicillin-binding protein [Kofleriaceae bacterium]
MTERRRARIFNASEGGLWWRIPCVLLLWAPIAAPTVIGLIAVGTLRDYARDLPRTPDLDAWEQAVPRTTVLVAADGTVLAEQPFAVGAEVGHRFPIAYDDVPPAMVQAVLAAEDVRFFEHRGVDAQAVVRAALANHRAGRVVEGASTLTQQVARNLLPEEIGYERSVRRKVREALLARRLERRYSKQRIFETYINHAFLGAGAYGIAAAARAYFGKSLARLDLAETAMIAGMAQAPGRADPYKDPHAARARRDEVLHRMARAGFISADEAAAAQARPIELSPPPLVYGTIAPWLTEHARRELDQELPAEVARGGLRVETTALPPLALETAALAQVATDRLGKDREHGSPELGAVVWDYRTGYIEALVGGRSWASSQFDRATQACRQPGSAFKPVLYTAALETGAITAGTPLRDAPISEYDYDNDVHWKPSSAGRTFRGVALAQDALAASLNAPAVDVLDRVGTAPVATLARRLGITSELADVRPMALGASCVIPIELAGAFATIARRGTAPRRVVITRIARGTEVLIDRAAPEDPWLAPDRRLDRVAALAGDEGELVLDPDIAFISTTMLRDVVLRGTGTAARKLRPIAGKTGTTNDNTDAWFVGFSGRVVGAVWLGHDDPKRTLGTRDDGGRAALPLWMQLVEAAETGRAPIEVPGEPPLSLVRARVDRETGLLAQPGAGGAIDLYFVPGTEPTQRVGTVHDVPADLGRMSREF